MNENQYPNNYNGQGYYGQQSQGYGDQYYQPAPGSYPPPQNNNQNNSDGVPTWVKVLIPSVAAVCLTIIVLVLTGVIGPKVSNEPVVSSEPVTAVSEPAETQTSLPAVVYLPQETTAPPTTIYVPVQSGYTIGRYKVTSAGSAGLFVRTGPGKGYASLKYYQLEPNAQQQIVRLSGRQRDVLVDGVVCDVSAVSGDWGKIPSGWICLRYCTKIS